MLRSVKVAQVVEYPVLERFWRDADEVGFHAVWDYDHFYGMREPTTPTYEGWSMLAAMAAVTSRIRIGCMVTGVTYRHPAILAKMAVSVDHVSSGRLEFGIGAGSHEGEHRGYGIPFPPAGTRIDMLDEACEVIRRLWTEDSVTHQGRFWTLTDALAYPKPVQARIPIVIGGVGERKTLRVVARHADEWNFSPWRDLGAEGPKEFARLSAVLDEHCAAIGRDPGRSAGPFRSSSARTIASNWRRVGDSSTRSRSREPSTPWWGSSNRRPGPSSSRSRPRRRSHTIERAADSGQPLIAPAIRPRRKYRPRKM